MNLLHFTLVFLGVYSQTVTDSNLKLTSVRDFSDVTSASKGDANTLLITTKGGKLMKFDTQSETLTDVFTFSVNTFGESGLLHTLVHNGNIYVLLVQPDTRTAIQKGTYSNGQVSNFRTIFMTNRVVSCGNHKGGQMRIDKSGNLYVSIGDQCEPDYSQDKQEFYGKVLRMDLQGQPNSFNPHFSEGGNARYVYARGLRNPFRMYINPDTDELYVNDVGQNTKESIYNIRKGDNYRWPNNGI